MNRRDFGKLTGTAAVAAATHAGALQPKPEDWKAGKDSPVHDSDRLVPVSNKIITLENDFLRVDCDGVTGALLGIQSKKTGWQVQRNHKLAESFRLFAPTPERSFNPILGARNRVESIVRAADAQSLRIIWSGLVSEFSGVLQITLDATIALDGDSVSFDMQVHNNSPLQVCSVEWPVVGALTRPPGSATLQNLGFLIGGYTRTSSVYPRFPQEMNGCGVSFPMQASEGRYNLLIGEKEGLYTGSHQSTGEEVTRYNLELKPGWLCSQAIEVPDVEEVSGHPVRIVHSVLRFPFAAPGETCKLARIVISPYQGDWHAGAEVYRRWFKTWFKRPVSPAWLDQPHTWQQIQTNSSEDDLRTSYKELPWRALQAARSGVTALQLVGWNNLGQDRNNPSHDTDPRCGTQQDLKDAIERIQKMGVRVILFNKYTWAETSTEWYRRELYKYMALDPNGVTYYHHGFKYQTPIQLADINTRRFSVACQNSEGWLRLCMREFEKSLDLNASGILYDEVMHHGGASYCFAPDHGHRVGASLYAGDIRLGKMFRDRIRETRGERNFLMAGEGLNDVDSELYALSYIRINENHMPVVRYNDPFAPIMVAVTGFNDREMVNSALQYRYIMSFEPFIFKGNMDDYPLTVAYGQKMEAFRKKYRQYVWDGEFRDNQDATVIEGEHRYDRFSVFIGANGNRAAVVVNGRKQPITVSVKFAGGNRSKLSQASPEAPEAIPFTGTVTIPAWSLALVMES